MPLSVQQPFGRDVTKKNPIKFLYLKGDEFTNGSLRLLQDDVFETKFEFQLRLAGVWNDTSIQVAGASVFIGRDLSVSGAGEWIGTSSAIDQKTSLIPHIQYDDSGTGVPHTPILGPKQFRTIVQGSDVSEVTGTSLESPIAAPSALLASRIYLKTGSVGATADILTTFRRDNGAGPIFWQKTLPKELMATPNTEFFIDFSDLLEGFANETVSHSFQSTELISLKTSITGDFWLASDFYPLSEEDLITASTGMDRVLTDSTDGHTISDNSGNLILSGGLI